MKINSTFAILDITKGRQHWVRRVEKGERIPVIIYGHIVRQHGRDDGTSIEFEIAVKAAIEETK